jgi:hypothetical protein
MPKPPLPPELDAFLAQPNPAVIGTVEPGGSPHTAPTWYLWRDGLSEQYTSRPYARRDEARVQAIIEVDSWHAWVHGRPWVPAAAGSNR